MLASEVEYLTISKSESWRMFDEISSKYDLLNHLLSFGLHLVWRKKLSQCLTDKKGQNVLDLATGTADVLLSLFKNNSHIKKGYGIDLADKMLAIGREKVAQKNLSKHITLKHGDATKIPFKNNKIHGRVFKYTAKSSTKQKYRNGIIKWEKTIFKAPKLKGIFNIL